jgi:hypothetical protein
MNKGGLVVLALCSAGTALAQDAGLSVSVGARAWYTEWTTFSYFVQNDVNLALTQVSADNKLVLMPIVSLRYGDFFGSLSAFPSTRFSFADGDSATRKEFDVNFGYAVVPGLALTLGYKKVSQGGSAGRYRPAGPVAGLSANAPLGGALSVYGSLGLGRLKTPSGDAIDFKADYRLTELGLAYTLGGDRPRWTFTGGYRIQVMSSKDAFGSQDGRDTTQGFTFGAIATF